MCDYTYAGEEQEMDWAIELSTINTCKTVFLRFSDENKTPYRCEVAICINWRLLKYVPADKLTMDLCKIAYDYSDGKIDMNLIPEHIRSTEEWKNFVASMEKYWKEEYQSWTSD